MPLPATSYYQGLAASVSATSSIKSFVTPVLVSLLSVGTLLATVFIIIGGIHYMTSSGSPAKMEHAKKTIRNAVIGLVLVIGAGVLTSFLIHSFASPLSGTSPALPTLAPIQTVKPPTGLVDVLIKAITGLLQNIIESAGSPFMTALKHFTISTPMMVGNKAVFNLWLTVLGIADGLFVVVIAALGLHVMSYETFGLQEIDIKTLLPRIGLIFLCMNTSIFAIDGVISLSNAMIHAVQVAFPYGRVWDTLITISSGSNLLGLAALMIMIVFLVLAAILLIYYVGRLVTLYLGAVLAPIVCLLFLIPSFKDFAMNAAKTYVTTIFVLFVHVIILVLAASIFAGIGTTAAGTNSDPIMPLILGLATVIALLKTQGVLNQLAYASIGPRTARKLGTQLATGISFLGGASRDALHASSMTSYHGRSARRQYDPKVDKRGKVHGFGSSSSSPTTKSKPLNIKPVAEPK